mmetsp:Transcript_36483/g.117585  ORF Transcript_36483/g.117585 Transcript_36483/m.117585 type:complete len:229 (+) Transcript_36483:401-1087(+)
MPFARCPVEPRATVAGVGHVDCRACVEELLHGFEVTIARSKVDRRGLAAKHFVGVGAGSEQNAHDRRVAIACGHHKREPAISSARRGTVVIGVEIGAEVDVGAARDEKLDDVVAFCLYGLDQGDRAACLVVQQVRTLGDEQLDQLERRLVFENACDGDHIEAAALPKVDGSACLDQVLRNPHVPSLQRRCEWRGVPRIFSDVALCIERVLLLQRRLRRHVDVAALCVQ